LTILFAVLSISVFRFRSRAALELKLVALQHQLAVLRRQRPGLSSSDGEEPVDVSSIKRDGSGQ
jgi:hypothetical protein